MIHTQEPWEIRKSQFAIYIVSKDGNGKIVTVGCAFPRGVAGCETEGNAYLLKAAPKMAEALKEMLVDWQSGNIEIEPKTRELIDKALAEAEGEGE